jgi:hypothetical protein
MNPLAKKLTLIVYVAIFGAIFVNYLMGLGWFGRYDKLVMLGLAAFAMLVGNWLKSRAEKKAQIGEVVVEALDANGAVRSDPGARRFIWQTVSIVAGLTIFVVLALAYRDRSQGGAAVYAITAVVMIIIGAGVCWRRFGNISEIQGEDGVTLTLCRRGKAIRVPWRHVESAEVSRPFSFWQVVLKFRCLDGSGTQTVRFLPMGWRKMTPAIAGKLQSALAERRLAESADRLANQVNR